MLICVECKTEMHCDKNGVGADFSHGHIYPADRFKCPVCHKMILKTNESAIHDPDHNTQDEYLEMEM